MTNFSDINDNAVALQTTADTRATNSIDQHEAIMATLEEKFIRISLLLRLKEQQRSQLI